MPSESNNIEGQIKSWVHAILKKRGATTISSVTVLGTNEKGAGYLGDIVFVNAVATTGNSTEEYKLALKYGKQSQALRETPIVKYVYLNEIFMYDQVFPKFNQFQVDRKVKDPFNSISKCYGTFVDENAEVIALDNLKERGFELWPKREPLTREHIDLVVGEYGKFHATSVAMKQHEPEMYQKLVDAIVENLKNRPMDGVMPRVMRDALFEAVNLLTDEIDENGQQRCQTFGENIAKMFEEMKDIEAFKVISHGDCWSNNFMYKYTTVDGKKVPTNVAMLDWQMGGVASPIWDLSYFLFCCTNADDFQNMDDILKSYHDSFLNHLKQLGVEEGDKIYSRDQFLEDWKQYGKSGFTLCGLIQKICAAGEDDEILDIEKGAEEGKSFAESFDTKISDNEHFKNRMRPVIQYVIKSGLI